MVTGDLPPLQAVDFYSRLDRRARAAARLFNPEGAHPGAAPVRDGSVSSSVWQSDLVLANDSLVPFPELPPAAGDSGRPAPSRSAVDIKVRGGSGGSRGGLEADASRPCRP